MAQLLLLVGCRAWNNKEQHRARALYCDVGKLENGITANQAFCKYTAGKHWPEYGFF